MFNLKTMDVDQSNTRTVDKLKAGLQDDDCGSTI